MNKTTFRSVLRAKGAKSAVVASEHFKKQSVGGVCQVTVVFTCQRPFSIASHY